MDTHSQIYDIIQSAGPNPLNSISVFKEIQSHLETKENPYYLGQTALGRLEFITTHILEEAITTSTPKLLERLASLTAQTPTENEDENWGHFVCHTFEEYSKGGGPSFLRDTQFFPAATILIDRAVQIQDGCFSRIVEPVADYNLHSIERNGRLDDTFAFKPASLNATVSAGMDDNEYDDFCKIFMRSQSPKIFMETLAENPPRIMYDTQFASIAIILDRDFGRDMAQKFFENRLKAIDPRETLAPGHAVAHVRDREPENWLEHTILNVMAFSRKQQGDIIPGIFVDVENTLLVNGRLNLPVISYISYVLDRGAEVTVFTGGSPERFSAVLSELGVDPRLLPVKSKKDYHGKCLGILIDDTPPDYQPFGADSYQKPFDSFEQIGYDLKEKWGIPQPARNLKSVSLQDNNKKPLP